MNLIWAKFVMDYTTIGSNKAQVITLKGLPCGELGIINIYAPNNYVDKNILWELLLEKIPRNYSWIVCGDFNMVEDKEDKSSMCEKLIPYKERLLWDALKLASEIHEPTGSNKSLKFSWDNQRSGGERIMARLDHIFIPNYLASNQANNSPHYYVKGDGVRSNCSKDLSVENEYLVLWKG
jgi:exonuclease III